MSNLHSAIGAFVATIRNPRTARAYSDALVRFEKIAPSELAAVDETLLAPFMKILDGYSIATKQLNLGAVIQFFAFLIYARMSDNVSLDRARLIKRKLIGRNPKRISNYNMRDVEALVTYAQTLTASLLDLRDRALILTLAETGLRKSEAASLRLCDVSYDNEQAVVIGKGDKQAVVYFGECSQQAVTEYIEARPDKELGSPLFMRHGWKGSNDHRTGPLHGSSINKIIDRRALEVLGHGIAVHALRHYFVTTVWQKTGGNLKLAQELARHESIAATERYAHVSNDVLRDAHRRVFA